MNKIVFLALINLFMARAFAELPFHQFDYPNKQNLKDIYYGNSLTITNCEECLEVPVSDYFERGILDLIKYEGVDRGIEQKWITGKKAIVIDYHHNYLHLMRLESRGEVNEVSIVKTYPISGGHGGVGNKPNTQSSPPGIHTIWRKQDGTEAGRRSPWQEDYIIDAYKAKRKTGVLTPSQDYVRYPYYREGGKSRSWQFVTTRILRLRGLEEQNDNSERGRKPKRRSILIHGTNEEGLIGIQASSGCIRMKGHDVIELFNSIEENSLVNITFVKDPWRTKPGKERVGRPNSPYWNFGKQIRKMSVEEADKRWVR